MSDRNPGLARRQVRLALKQARDARGRTQQETASALDWSVSKLIRIENGSVGISVTDLRALLAYYDVTSEDETERLIAAVRASKGRPWWHEYHELIRPQYAQLLAYEAGASNLQVYHHAVIPALLQTPSYAYEIKAAVEDETARNRLVELLTGRQEILGQSNDIAAEFIIDESALYRVIGNDEIMAEQLSELLVAMDRANISIRVLPYTAGAHPGIPGPFILLGFPDGDDNVVFLEGITGDVISREDEELRKHFIKAFQTLADLSLTPEESTERIATRQAAFAAAASSHTNS